MQGGHDEDHDGTDPSSTTREAPSGGSSPTDASPDVSPDASSTEMESATGTTAVAVEPVLPYVEAKPPPPMSKATIAPVKGAETWYRTDQDRYKSVHRRANPWHRRAARGIIGMTFLAAAGAALFFAARVVQDYLERDKLPAIGADTPDVRATSIEVRSTSPAPVVDGTITLDTTSGAFEFLGRGTGPQAGTQLVSPDGVTVFIRRGTGAWQSPESGDQVVTDVRRAVSYLRDDKSADAILTSHLRRGYVDLIERTEVGEGDDRVTRYQMRLDTDSFDADFPLQYREFQDRAIPGVTQVRALPVTIALDEDNVLVEVNDESTNWSWQRLTYADQPFRPLDPADQLLTDTIVITDGTVGDG